MRNTYTPRRANAKRWLNGAPPHVLDCFQNKSGTWDVLYTGHLLSPAENRTYANCEVQGREMDREPCHPQGVGMGFSLKAHEAAAYRYRNGKRRVTWESLPEKVKACAIADGKR